MLSQTDKYSIWLLFLAGPLDGARTGSERAPMTPDRALDYLNAMLWGAALVAGPIMLATLLAGLIVSVFQVATQIRKSR